MAPAARDYGRAGPDAAAVPGPGHWLLGSLAGAERDGADAVADTWGRARAASAGCRRAAQCRSPAADLCLRSAGGAPDPPAAGPVAAATPGSSAASDAAVAANARRHRRRQPNPDAVVRIRQLHSPLHPPDRDQRPRPVQPGDRGRLALRQAWAARLSVLRRK